MDARRRWLVGSSIGLVAGCGALIRLSLQECPSQMRLRAKHAWERATSTLDVYPFGRNVATPTGLAGYGADRLRTDTDRLVLWFRFRDASGVERCNSRLTATTTDVHGCRVRCNDRRWLAVPLVIAWGNLPCTSYPLPLQAFPRRSPSFRIRLENRSGPSEVADFSVSNPKASAAKVWQTGRRSVEVRTGNLRVVLRSLTHLQDIDRIARSTAVFDCYEAGQPTQNWRANRVSVSDATGNELTTEMPDLPQGRTVEFDALCRFEAAWKLWALLTRVPAARAAGDRSRTVEFLVKP